jgi:molecular chaperone GrpE
MNKEEKNMKSEEKKNNQNDHTTQQEESRKESENNQQEEAQQQQAPEGEEAEEQQPENADDTSQQEKKEKKKDKKDKKQEKKREKSDKEKLAELQDRYLRLQAEYDNYRKRTLREKMELTRSAGEDILQGLLPVMDDFERALQSIDEAENAEAFKDGVHLIYGKFKEFLRQQGVKEMESQDQEFDTDKHEAISKVPAPSEDMKGKVVDVVQTGYYLNDKVLRYAKVVVGE